MADHIVDVKVSVNDYTSSSVHTLRELTMKGLEAEKANEFLKGVENSISHHYHGLATGYEKFVREDPAQVEQHKGEESAIAEATLKILEGYIEGELDYLRKEHGWSNKQMPAANYRALRNIINCLKYGGSLLTYETVSQCKKFAAQAKKAATEAAAKAHADATGKDSAGSTEAGGDLNVDGPGAAEIAKLVKTLAEAYKLHPEFARSLTEATTGKAQSIVDKAKAKLAEAVAKKAA